MPSLQQERLDSSNGRRSLRDSHPPSSYPESANGSNAQPRRQSVLGGDSRVKPLLSPKPPQLHGHALAADVRPTSSSGSSSNVDALASRFARLRPGDAPQQAPKQGLLDTTPPSFEKNASQSAAVAYSAPHANGVALSSPLPIHPSKDLPRPPSPTYSPAKATMHSGASGHTSRYASNSFPSPAGSVSSLSSVQSIRTPATHSAAYPPYPTSSNPAQKSRPVPSARRKSLNMPMEVEISAQKLHDYLRMHEVLLIDVRSREDYDSGHIFYRTSICIEPEAVRHGMSADQLQEALVVSPDEEVALFTARDRFDLVVYYDQSTQSTKFLRDHLDTPLRYLYDALYEYNQDKPLQFPPIFLKGGLDAWTDLVGTGGLQTSNTAAIARGSAPRTFHQISRKPLITRDSRLRVQKKRHRDYNPLDAEEEEKWRERARSESAALDQQPPASLFEHEGMAQIEPYLQTYQDFHNRFPDVSSMELGNHVPKSQIPEYPMAPVSSYEHPELTSRGPPPPPPPPPHTSHPQVPPPPVPAHPSRPPPIVQRPSYAGVNERPTSQGLAPKAQLTSYVSPTLKRLPKTGLYNFGATCYMNATIQSLSGTIPLTAFFLDGTYQKHVQKDNWKGSKGIMPEYFTILLRNLWQPNGVDTIRPTNFKKLSARLNKEWASDRQQDAKEFLEFLIDCLHEDLNVNWSRTPLRQLTDAEEAERERTPPFIASKKEWDRYLHRDHSRITDLFAGQHISRLQCTTCGTSSTTYEAFYSISVEIPMPTREHPHVTLYDCLRSYCATERLSGDEVWHCPHCKRDREATKQITISRAPDFLVVHFKRFSASHSERAKKIHVPVHFPLNNLDLEPFMLPPPNRHEVAAIAARYEKGGLEVPVAMRRPYRYNCYAVMRHLGSTMTSGHYISVVKDAARGVWREFNDERIGDYRPQDLRFDTSEPYILFYQRVDV